MKEIIRSETEQLVIERNFFLSLLKSIQRFDWPLFLTLLGKREGDLEAIVDSSSSYTLEKEIFSLTPLSVCGEECLSPEITDFPAS